MKYKINILLLAVLAIFAACNNRAAKQDKQKEKTVSVQNNQYEKILSVEIAMIDGSVLSQNSKIILTKDSIHSYSGRYGKINKEHYTAMPAELWNDISTQCNLEEFTKIPNGESTQPFDGTDTKITIETNRRKIAVTNGKGEEWDKMNKLLNGEINSWAKSDKQ